MFNLDKKIGGFAKKLVAWYEERTITDIMMSIYDDNALLDDYVKLMDKAAHASSAAEPDARAFYDKLRAAIRNNL